jgi:hypothetical protein
MTTPLDRVAFGAAAFAVFFVSAATVVGGTTLVLALLGR